MFNRPTLSQLIDQADQDIHSRLPATDLRSGHSRLSVLGRVLAGMTHGIYGFLENIFGALFVTSAAGVFLDWHGQKWGISRKAPSYAGGPVAISGAESAAIPAGTLLIIGEVQYKIAAEAEIAEGGSVDVAVKAETPGLDGNAAAGAKIALVSPVAGVASQAVVAAGGIVGGFDRETDESLRGRILDRIRNPAHGGADEDYVAWALEVPGVTRAWVYPRELGPGTVTVRVMIDGRIPTDPELEPVRQHIDGKRPATADVFVLAPVPVAVDCELLIAPDLPSVRAAVTAALAAAIAETAGPGGLVLKSKLQDAVGGVEGVQDYNLTAPAANVQMGTGEIAVMGGVTWTS